MIWLTKDIVLERYAKEDNPIKIGSVLVFLVGGMGAVFLAVGLILQHANGPDTIFFVLGGLLMLLAAIIFVCSVHTYLSVRRRVMEDDFRSVKVTCTYRNLTRQVLSESDRERAYLELHFEDQKGNVHRRKESNPPPELMAIEKGSVHYLVGIKKNRSWRLFQLYSANEWRVDW